MSNSQSCLFIVGISQRSGTNYIYDLLLSHPDVIPLNFGEDSFLRYSNHLVEFSKCLAWFWKNWTGDYHISDELLKSIGDGICLFLDKSKKKESLNHCVLITKTPFIENIDNFYRFFPTSYLIIIVRDLRDIIVSGMETFNWNFEIALQDLKHSAAVLENFRKRYSDKAYPYRIIQYEKLFQHTEKELKDIIEFLNLDSEKINKDDISTIAVRGSCSAKENNMVHWDPVKIENFNPIKRWQKWTAYKKYRFEWVCGKYNQYLGFKGEDAVQMKIFWIIVNCFMDICWILFLRQYVLLRKIVSYWKRKLYENATIPKTSI